ncbi:alpha/beta hydrolase [Aurantiacibacter spongiae]|uniref:alpha/beta hydrolase n=1 Tax=Aurantiacibacter spongiae TaxID=2488860 RepID=UPI0015F2C57D|nr:alpha/beta hydrolase [Aurantiacibacter spongiae]
MSALGRLILLAVTVSPTAALAHTTSVAEEEWVEVSPAAMRYVSPQQAHAEQVAVAAFGPFRVLDDRTVALVGITDDRSPAQFSAMLDAFPGIATLEFVEAPGTHDDRANLALGRMIRAHGLATRVRDGGSVRSGAVELFLAGITREIAPGSEFAVHGWLDDQGRGAQDYPEGAAEHRRYLDYYAEMGMDAEQARAFYAMTNSVPFEDARWLTGAQMRDWMDGSGGTQAVEQAQPRLAYLDLAPTLQ